MGEEATHLMAWTAGPLLIAPGENVRVNFGWDGAYMGAQFAVAQPIERGGMFIGGFPGGELETTAHGVSFIRGREHIPVWTYHVLVRNIGTSLYVFFELTGGEVEP